MTREEMGIMNKKLICPYLAAIGSTCIFGLSFVFSRIALQFIEPLHLLALRFLFAVLLMNVLRLFQVIHVNTDGSIVPLIILGLIQPGLYFIFETIGIQMTSASVSGMLVAVIPIFTIILARIFLREKPNIYQTAAVIISVAGVVQIAYMQNNSEMGGSALGMMVLLGAALSGASYSVFSRWLSLKYSPVSITYVMMNIGFVLFLPLSIIQLYPAGGIGGFFAPLSNGLVLTAVIYLGFCASVGGFFLLNYTLSQLPAYKVGSFDCLTTLVAVASSAIFLKEQLHSVHIIGGIFVVFGVWGVNYFSVLNKKKLHTRTRQEV